MSPAAGNPQAAAKGDGVSRGVPPGRERTPRPENDPVAGSFPAVSRRAKPASPGNAKPTMQEQTKPLRSIPPSKAIFHRARTNAILPPSQACPPVAPRPTLVGFHVDHKQVRSFCKRSDAVRTEVVSARPRGVVGRSGLGALSKVGGQRTKLLQAVVESPQRTQRAQRPRRKRCKRPPISSSSGSLSPISSVSSGVILPFAQTPRRFDRWGIRLPSYRGIDRSPYLGSGSCTRSRN